MNPYIVEKLNTRRQQNGKYRLIIENIITHVIYIYSTIIDTIIYLISGKITKKPILLRIIQFKQLSTVTYYIHGKKIHITWNKQIALLIMEEHKNITEKKQDKLLKKIIPKNSKSKK